MTEKEILEIKLLNEEISNNKVDRQQKEISYYVELTRNIILIIGSVILFIFIQNPESILNRKNSEETTSRERAKLILEVINYDNPEKIYQGLQIIKYSYPNTNDWMTKIENAILKNAKFMLSEELSQKYRKLNEQKKCLEELMNTEMSGHRVKLPCGTTTGMYGYGARAKEIKKNIEIRTKELDELVELYGLDKNIIEFK